MLFNAWFSLLFIFLVQWLNMRTCFTFLTIVILSLLICYFSRFLQSSFLHHCHLCHLCELAYDRAVGSPLAIITATAYCNCISCKSLCMAAVIVMCLKVSAMCLFSALVPLLDFYFFQNYNARFWLFLALFSLHGPWTWGLKHDIVVIRN